MAHGKFVTQEEKESIISLYKLGKTPLEISKIINRSPQTVDRVRRVAGLDPHNKNISEAGKNRRKEQEADEQITLDLKPCRVDNKDCVIESDGKYFIHLKNFSLKMGMEAIRAIQDVIFENFGFGR